MILLDLGAFTYRTPEWVNVLSHTALLIASLYLGYRVIRSGASLFALGFLLFALGEVIYMTYHFGLTALLFVHLLGDGIVFVALVIIFAGLLRRGIIRDPVPEPRTAPAVETKAQFRAEEQGS